MHTLISFLGKGKQDKTTGYKEANYVLGDKIVTTPFFGVELTRFIQPQQLLLIGTAGSMWDVFFDQHASDEKVLDLIDAVANQSVTEDLLNDLTPQIAQYLGCDVKCMVISYARDEQEQVSLLQRIAEQLNPNDTISLDISHAFRHLPMLALVASRFLKNIKNIQTQKIYYGALEMTENDKTPVVELDGLLKMLDWVDALSVYNHNGNYQVFSPMFERENGQKQADLLHEAAFFENTNQVHKAHAPLATFRRLPELASPFTQLFADELQKRTQWATGQDFGARQLKMAEFYLNKADYLRASILLQEAWISKMVKLGDKSDFNSRKKAQDEFESQAVGADQNLFDELKALRNALAHGTKAFLPAVRDALSDETKLRQKLKAILLHVQQWR